MVSSRRSVARLHSRGPCRRGSFRLVGNVKHAVIIPARQQLSKAATGPTLSNSLPVPSSACCLPCSLPVTACNGHPLQQPRCGAADAQSRCITASLHCSYAFLDHVFFLYGAGPRGGDEALIVSHAFYGHYGRSLTRSHEPACRLCLFTGACCSSTVNDGSVTRRELSQTSPFSRHEVHAAFDTRERRKKEEAGHSGGGAAGASPHMLGQQQQPRHAGRVALPAAKGHCARVLCLMACACCSQLVVRPAFSGRQHTRHGRGAAVQLRIQPATAARPSTCFAYSSRHDRYHHQPLLPGVLPAGCYKFVTCVWRFSTFAIAEPRFSRESVQTA